MNIVKQMVKTLVGQTWWILLTIGRISDPLQTEKCQLYVDCFIWLFDC